MKHHYSIWKIIGGCVITIFLCAFIGMAILLSKSVQQRITHFICATMTEQLGTRVSIRSVNYAFPLHLSLHDVYMEDQQGDSLLFIKRCYVHLSAFAFRHQMILVRELELDDVYLDCHPLPNGEYNYAFLLPEILSTDTSEKKQQWAIRVNRMDCNNWELRYDSLLMNLETADWSFEYDSLMSWKVCLENLQGSLQRLESKESIDICSMQVQVIGNDSVLSAPKLRIELPHSLLDASGI